ncbi:MAG: peptidase M50 [Rivularia sp. (in: Bacteria)]|nr:peptidase M50 [Rivularia sp. MS3]
MQYLLYPVVIYALLVGVSYVVTFLQLCKVTMQYPSYQVRAVENIPSYLQKLFLVPIQELQEFGFEPCCFLQVKPMLKVYPNTAWEMLLYNEPFNCYAKVGIRHPIEPVNLFDIEFYTFFKDKTCLVTTNGKGNTVIGKIPFFIMQDFYTAQTSLQWQYHQGRLRQLKTHKIPKLLSPEAFTQALGVYLQNYLNSLIKLRYISPGTNQKIFRLNGNLALKLTHKIIQGNHQSANIIKQRREQAKNETKLAVEIPIELEVEGFRRMEKLQRGLIDKKMRPWMILGSFILFVVTSTKYFGTQTLIIFVAALIIHEGGHLLAMKLCGYRDGSLLFLPFLGAVATARKDDATITQKFCVSLAGPLPGLILGILLAIFFKDVSYSSWIKQASWILICLNLFNLLPIYPLDGGQIVDILLFSRFPYSDVFFKAFGAIIISLLGIAHPALYLLTIPLAVNIIYSYRAAKINSKLHKSFRANPPSNQENILYCLFKNLQQFDYHHLPFNSRYLLVKNLIERYHCFYSKRITKVILASVYCVSLLVGILGSWQAIVPNSVNFIPKFAQTSPDYVRIHREMPGE